jgi:hypothetical protein
MDRSEGRLRNPPSVAEAAGVERALTVQRLEHENVRYRGTAGVSAGNRSLGFQPAFVDRETRAIYLSRFADGRPAPCHVLGGLPCDLVRSRRACGRVAGVKPSLVSDFVRDGRFYTREEAAAQAAPVAEPAR